MFNLANGADMVTRLFVLLIITAGFLRGACAAPDADAVSMLVKGASLQSVVPVNGKEAVQLPGRLVTMLRAAGPMAFSSVEVAVGLTADRTQLEWHVNVPHLFGTASEKFIARLKAGGFTQDEHGAWGRQQGDLKWLLVVIPDDDGGADVRAALRTTAPSSLTLERLVTALPSLRYDGISSALYKALGNVTVRSASRKYYWPGQKVAPGALLWRLNASAPSLAALRTKVADAVTRCGYRAVGDGKYAAVDSQSSPLTLSQDKETVTLKATQR